MTAREDQRTGSRAIRPMFVVGGLYSMANGVAWIMRDLAAALGRAGAPVDVYAADCWGRGAQSIGHIFEPPSRWYSEKGLWLGGLSWSPLLKRRIHDAVHDYDIIHSHSLWMLPNSYACRSAVMSGKPTVITAHGALEPWARQRSSWKKRFVSAAFQSRDLMESSCIHVNSLAEIEGVRDCGISAPIAVIPNGIQVPDLANCANVNRLSDRFPTIREKRIVLFMARLHEKKGLQYLLPAWEQLTAEFPDWHLVIAGPDSGYRQQTEQFVRTSGLEGSVSLVGALHGAEKEAALASASIFAHPSISEGFSMSILEAMAYRLPVLITPGCNFPEVVKSGAGMSVDASVGAVVEGLGQMMRWSNEEREEAGRHGRTLVETGYTWDSVAEQTLDLYQWLIYGGKRPDFVIV